jgi:hypothetical protein
MRQLILWCIVSAYAGFQVGAFVMSLLTARREQESFPPQTKPADGCRATESGAERVHSSP